MVHHGAALDRESGDVALKGTVVSGDFETLPARMRQLCRYSLKLTVLPWSMGEGDIEALREAGLSDRDVVDANQVVSYFNYVNRVADGLGVEFESSWPESVPRQGQYDLRYKASTLL